MNTNTHLWSYLTQFFLEWAMFHTKVLEKMKTHILYSETSFWKLYHLRDMWKNIENPDRLQMTIWHICIACWITKATNTHSEYVILTAFPLQQWLHKRTSILCYTYTNHTVWCSQRQTPDTDNSHLMVFLMHFSFKFQSPAHHAGFFNPVPKG